MINKDNLDNTTQKNEEPINLTIHSIFTKDISYEAPSTPQVFSLPWEPQVKFDIQVMRRLIEQTKDVYEVILNTTVSTKLKLPDDNKPNKEMQEMVAFLIDVKLAGIFTVKGVDDSQLDRILSTTAPTIIFPYVAETVSSLAIKGGFPQFILPPIDFATIYQQRLDNQTSEEKYFNTDSNDKKTVN